MQQTQQLINELIAKTKETINAIERYKSLDIQTLNWRINEQSWSVLECIAHLNLYGDFYLVEIDKKLSSANLGSSNIVKGGFLGQYFAKSMLPKEKLNKMKTFKDKDPIHSQLSINELDKFIEQQHQLLVLLEKSRAYNLNKIRISISISKIIKLKLGDTFQFYINHQLRHLRQMERVLEAFNRN
jgi:hypothetical protein